MIRSLLLVLALSIAGDTIADRLDAFVPGGAIGLACLTGYFVVHGGTDDGTARLFDLAAPHFPFFFVPAAVGVVANLDALASSWMLIAAAIVLSTTAVIAATAILAQVLLSPLNDSRVT